MGAPGVDQVVADALRVLERTDAVIIDVRRNGGGSGEMSHLVFSHFLGAQPVPTINVVNRGTGERREQRSVAEVPGPRRPDVPLYVLTSQATGSAAEEFSFVLKNLGRATVVGDRTAGAGHMVGGFNASNGFVTGVSITRVTDPRTGREWERVGVQPDVKVAPERALDAAHALALRAVAAKSSDAAHRRTLDLTAETMDARARGIRPDAARLARLACTYEGDRSVEVSEGRLWYRRRSGVPQELVALGGDRFALGATRLAFDTTGAATRLTIEQPDGTTLAYSCLAAQSATR
jgi:hypothetical protein